MWLTPGSDNDSDQGDEGGTGGSHRSAAAGSRQTLLLVGRGRAVSAATDPIVLVPTGSADPDAVAAAEPATPDSSPAKTTPAAAKTTVTASPGGPRVTAASISVEPASVTGPCPRQERYVRVTMKVTITVSVPDVRLRYTVDGGKELGTMMRSKTYTDTWEANAKRAAGTYTSTLKVTAPSAASDTATFRYTCD